MNKKNYKFWDNTFLKSDWGQYSSEDLIRFISKACEKLKKKKILEIGCGTGANFNLFLDKKAKVTGIDFSKIAITKINKKFKKQIKNGDINLITGDIKNLNFENQKFNILVDNCVTCCLSFEETKSFYENVSKFLLKNSKIYIRTFAINSWGYKEGKKISYNMYIPFKWSKGLGPQRFSSAKDIRAILNKNYKVISMEIISRTVNNQKHLIKEWIVYAKKK